MRNLIRNRFVLLVAGVVLLFCASAGYTQTGVVKVLGVVDTAPQET